jgi:hypothetical protein
MSAATAKPVPIPTATKWTKEKAEKALKDGKYMKLESKSNDLFLSGAAKKWATDPLFAYIPQFRIAGHLETDNGAKAPLYTFLTEVIKLTQMEAVSVLRDGTYNVSSVAGDDAKAPYNVEEFHGKLAPQFKAELAAVAQMRSNKPAPKKGPSFTLADINKLGALVKEAGTAVTIEKKAKAAKKPSSGASSSTGRSKPLFDRVLKLNQGKVFDVSSYDAKGSSGAKSINLPKGPNSKKILVAIHLVDPATKVAVVKNLVSNDAESLKHALEQIYHDDPASVQKYLATWAAANKPTVAPVTNGVSMTVPVVGVKGVAASPQAVVMPPSSYVPSNGVKSPVMSMASAYGIPKM